LKTEKDVILEAIRAATYKHGDETGWKVNGVNHWLWAFVNDHWAFFDIHRSRGSRVPIALIGSPYQGILITDFFNAYDCLTGAQQKCLVHLRREIRRCRGNDPPDDFVKPDKKFKRLLVDALRLEQLRAKLTALVYKRRVRLIHKRWVDFATDTYSNKDWQRLSKRLLQYENEILLFLDVPGLPSDNNPAERMIRPHVIIRNRSFQNRTINGAIAHSTLTSLIHTLRLQNKQPFHLLQSAYLHHRQGLAGNVLFN
jgi:transposase